MALSEEDRKEIQLIAAKEFKDGMVNLMQKAKNSGFSSLNVASNIQYVIEKILSKRVNEIEASIIEKTDPQRAEALRRLDSEF